MYKAPTSRRRRKLVFERPNLIPILDSVFIFIFFLMMSASFVKIFEIQSDVPIISESEPPKDDKPPLALTLQISDSGFEIYTGVPSTLFKNISKDETGKYNINALHMELIEIKKNNLNDKTIIFQPVADISYEELVAIMDGVRELANTDDSLFTKDKEGVDIKVGDLFSNIIFGNIKS